MNLAYVENGRGGRFITGKLDEGSTRDLVAEVTEWMLNDDCLFVVVAIPEEAVQLCDNWLRKFPDIPLTGHSNIDWRIYGKSSSRALVLYRSDLISGYEAVQWAGGQVVN